MATQQPYEAETLLPPGTIADPARSSVANSLGAPASSNGGQMRESQYSSAPLNPLYDPYGGTGTSSPRVTTPSQYRDDPNEKTAPVEAGYGEKSKRSRGPWFWVLVGLVALAVIIVAVIVPVYYKVIKPSNAAQTSSSSPGSTASAAEPTQSETPQAAVTGGDGSQVTTDTGHTFTYNNSFGGFWYYDPKDPFGNKAQAQSWSPPLNEKWKFGTDLIRGVNLGGWLVLEPFISPALYEPYMNTSTPAIDEWTLCENLANDPSSGGVAKAIEEHYKTFITEEDFAQIAAAGLNWVRIPMPYWAIEVYPGEPFLEGVAWKYFVKAIEWARKYGLRVKLDLHTAPGSQNAYNHSGMMGRVGWLNGTMGIANAQRTLNHLRIFTQFISQPQYKDVVLIFGIINEAPMSAIPRDPLERFYLEAYNMIRNITGNGEGNGPWISVHDGFDPLDRWADFMPGSDRVMLDTHPYYSFGDQDASSPANQNRKPCTSRARAFNESMAAFGMTISGEFSSAFNDCGFFLNGVNLGARYDGTFRFYNGANAGAGSCVKWMDQRLWSTAEREAIRQFALSSFDSYRNFFFWTWKIGESTTWGNIVASPLWSYKHGLENGYMPKDPREAIGTCGNASPWEGPLPASKTGGTGAGIIPASYATARTWPPPSLSRIPNAATLPTYTATGTLVTLKPAEFTGAAGINGGNGWANSADQQGLYTPIAGCPYPSSVWGDAADATQIACSGGSSRRSVEGRYVLPRETGVPVR
ncbi:putative glucan 1,3-beta-glucosidase D [Rhizoctonia solani AG-1 IB]|uniref:glucan 1,3-beta-glucosidase n=1 Tax=Thanatephorus cucumeris (strain AG1-IB / isolate 7/3/14) TaxID=1108050 RepID=M5BYF3_THACB|nr:putative glucan 1,3-beta-glucosidase D [Rhizoctonia solani AG-1 IB]